MAAERSRSRSRSPGSKRIALKEAIDTLVEVAKSLTEARLSLREAERAADEETFIDAFNEKHEREAKAGFIPEYKPPIIVSAEYAKQFRERSMQEAQNRLLEARAALTSAEKRLTLARVAAHLHVDLLCNKVPENVTDMLDNVGV